jgi:hypothetical protein
MDAFPLEFSKINPSMDKNLQISKEKSLIQKTLKLKLYKEFLIRNHYQNVKINGIIFIMKNFTGQN